IIKDCSLARRDGRLRRIKLDSHAMVFDRMNCSRRLDGSISNPNVSVHRTLRKRDRHPVHARRHEFPSVQLIFAADHQLISGHIDLDDIKSFAGCNADAFTLSDREVVQTLMLTDRMAVDGLYFSTRGARFTHFVARVVFYKSRVVAVRHKADFLALRLCAGFQIEISSNLPHLSFRQIPQRKNCSGKLLLSHLEQEIGLILREIATLPQHKTVAMFIVLDARVVSGCDAIRANLSRHRYQSRELQLCIAGYTRNRSSPRQIITHKRPYDRLFKLLLEIQNVIWNPKIAGDCSSVVYVIQRTTARRHWFFVGRQTPALIPQLHRETDQIEPVAL